MLTARHPAGYVRSSARAIGGTMGLITGWSMRAGAAGACLAIALYSVSCAPGETEDQRQQQPRAESAEVADDECFIGDVENVPCDEPGAVHPEDLDEPDEDDAEGEVAVELEGCEPDPVGVIRLWGSSSSSFDTSVRVKLTMDTTFHNHPNYQAGTRWAYVDVSPGDTAWRTTLGESGFEIDDTFGCAVEALSVRLT